MGIDNVEDISPRRQYTAAVGQTVFAYPFPVFEDTDLVVDVDGATLALGTDYTVSGVTADTGGNVTLLSALSGGEVVTIYRDIPIQRTVDFQQNGPLSSAAFNDELDRITLVEQQLESRIGRALRLPINASATDAQNELSPISNWVGKFLAISNAGILEAANVVSSVVSLTQSVIGNLLNPQTAAEATAGVDPPYKWYKPGNVKRYGAIGDNSADDTTALQNCINCSTNDEMRIPKGTYKHAGLTLVSGLRIVGASRGGAVLAYTGSGIGIDAWTLSNLSIENLSATTTNTAATGMRFGKGAQQISLRNVGLTGDTSASNTGIGILLDAANPGAFSGNFSFNMGYVLGYKYSVKATGHDAATNTWTSMSFYQTYLLGRSSPIAGSKGLWFDANTNGVGSSFTGGTIEGFATGLECDNGSSGLDFCADNEGNTVKYSVGATFAGRIKNTNTTGDSYDASTNGATNLWHRRRDLNGSSIEESYATYRFHMFDANGSTDTWGLYRGPAATSYLDGTSDPDEKFSVTMGTAGDTEGERNFIRLAGHRLFFKSAHSGQPDTVASQVGDICFNLNAAAGGIGAYICVVAGTPGTWIPFGSIRSANSYSYSNHTDDRVLNETGDTLAQVANVLGTLIKDLQATGILQ